MNTSVCIIQFVKDGTPCMVVHDIKLAKALCKKYPDKYTWDCYVVHDEVSNTIKAMLDYTIQKEESSK